MKHEKPPKKTEKSKVKDFTNEDDVKESNSMTKDKSSIIRIKDDEKAPIYLLDSKYSDGFSHWVKVSSGDSVRVPCCGGIEGGGRAPDDCPICKYVTDLYNRASKAKGREAEALRKEAGDMRASYEIYFVAAKGSENVVKIEGTKHITKVEFDDPQIGLIRLSKAQYNTFRSIPTKYPYIVGFKDLFNRYIIFDKKVRDEDDWATVEMIPAKKPTPKPDVEIPEEITIEGLFDVDMKLAKSTLNLHLTDDEDEEEVDYENDDDEEDEDMARPAKKATAKPTKAKKRQQDDDDDDDEYLDEGTSDEFDDEEDDDEEDSDFDEDDEEDVEDDEEDDESDDDEDSSDEDDVEDDDTDFDDDFLDDVDDDFDDDEFDDEEEEPAVPAKSKKGASKAPAKAEKKAPAKAAPKAAPKKGKVEEKPRRGRPPKEEAPAKKASSKAPAKAPAKGKAPAEAPKKRGRPAKVEAPVKSKAPAKNPRK